jgi:hypothetical protein
MDHFLRFGPFGSCCTSAFLIVDYLNHWRHICAASARLVIGQEAIRRLLKAGTMPHGESVNWTMWEVFMASQPAHLSGDPVRRRRLLVFGVATVSAVMGFVACGSEGSGGTRDDPYPYSKDRVDRLRTQM